MPIRQFEKILQKAKREGFNIIGLYNWTEPFLNKRLENYVSMVKKYGLYCGLSSNLSIKPTTYTNVIQNALRAGVDSMLVSVSGFNQEIYEINHVGGNIEWVKENLEMIALMKKKRQIKTRIFLKFIKFDYNRHEEELLRNYASKIQIEFEIIDGQGDPRGTILDVGSEEKISLQIVNFTGSAKPANDTNSAIHEVCPLVFDSLLINHKGMAYLCCAFPSYKSLEIGSYLEMPEKDLLVQRHNHPFCSSCSLPRRRSTAADLQRMGCTP